MQLASNDGLHPALYWLLRQHGSIIRSLEIRADWKAASYTIPECREVHALFWRSGLSVFIQQPEWRGTFRIVDWVTTYAGKLTSLKIVAVDEERKSDGSPSLLLHEVRVLLSFLTNLQNFDLVVQRASSYDIVDDLANCGSLVQTLLAVRDGRISTLFERSFNLQSSVRVKLFAWCYSRAMLKHLDLRTPCEDLASLARLMRTLGRPDFALETVRLRITQLFVSGPSLDPRIARAIVPCLKTLELSGNSEPFPLDQVSWPTALQLVLHPATPLEALAFETDWLDGLHDAITTFHDRQPVKTLKTVRISTSAVTSGDPVRPAELAILKRDLGAWSRASQVDVVFEERA